jgi:Leucine-rich repeat (LRR) protein
MKTIRMAVIVGLLAVSWVGPAVAEEPVHFNDANLKGAVEAALGKANPTPTDMLALTTLSAPFKGITDLTGLETATNLTQLYLYNNQITDVSPLAGLTKLTIANLMSNHISDITALSGLTNLTSLTLSENQISDVSALSGLTNLTILGLSWNQISDISPLSGMTNLWSLDLGVNQFSDIAVLSGMTNLSDLSLNNTQISDISVLSGLTNLTSFNLGNNQISDVSPLSSLTNLTILTLGNNQISDISALSALTNLTALSADDNHIADISALSGMTNLTSLTLADNRISDISALSSLTSLRWLSLNINQISDVSALSSLTRLEVIGLSRNRISDISALSGLTHLTYLNLETNPLNEDACNVYIPIIIANNPGIVIGYDPCASVQYTLTISSAGGGSVTTPGEGTYSYDSGTTVSVAASPQVDCHFVNWTGTAVTAGKVANSSSASTTVTMDADYTLQANFALDLRSLTISSSTGGTVTAPGIGSFSYPHGTVVTVSASAQTNYHFVHWTGTAVTAGKVANPSSASTNVTMDGDYTLQANFEANGPGGQYTLTISSTAGGTVTTPGVGTFQYPGGQTVMLQAQAKPLFQFAGWTGSHASSSNSTSITMNDDYEVKANFVSLLATLYVDDNAPNDPEPNDSSVSDPDEDGTPAHPFDSIQEAIEVAANGTTVVVGEGSYAEQLDFLGKSITVIGSWLLDPNVASEPGLDGDGAGPLVTFTGGEDANCTLAGLRIQGGRAVTGAAIVCRFSSPTISNCLIVGNRATDPAGAVIYCWDGHAMFINCTITGNAAAQGGAVMAFADAGTVVSNSIIWANAPSTIRTVSGFAPTITYCDIEGGWPGAGDLSADPLFAEPGHWSDAGTPSYSYDDFWVAGDHHLHSQAGRWDCAARTWVTDTLSSPCIDAGDPNANCMAEPSPNGDRINLGAYGGTSQASLASQNQPGGDHGGTGDVHSGVEVPNVVGMGPSEARSVIASASLVVWAEFLQCSNTVPMGRLISQDPAAGTMVSVGSAVSWVISSGPCPISVPDVVGLTQPAAQSAITAAGLVVGTVTQAASGTEPKGSVISQSPLGGTSVVAGSLVNLVVSTGPTTGPATGDLVARWTLDEASGDIAYDSAAQNDGVTYGGPVWQPTGGKVGGALKFDGADDYVQLPIGPLIASLTNSTFATWVNWSGTGGDFQRVFDFGSGMEVNMFLTPLGGGGMRFAVTTAGGGGEDQANATEALPTGWHHVTVTINAASMTYSLYLDGQLKAASTATRYTPSSLGNTTQNWLGRSQYVADPYFNGSLDDFRIYNRVLSPTEVAQLAVP